MQYPIIDSLTMAYINNGWTGLVVKPFSIWDEEWEIGSINNEGQNFNYDGNIRSKGYIAIVPSTSYYFAPASNVVVYWYDSSKNFISLNNPTSEPITSPNNAHFVRFRTVNAYGNTYKNDISINFPSSYHEYISYIDSINNEKYNKNNIAHRLKLPLSHYFPHPVIDALQRAAAGTQTADDTEVLRHYLTPLGIGGI